MYLVSFASMILQGPPNIPDGSGKVQGVISNKYLRVDFGLFVSAECANDLRNRLQWPNQIDRAKPSYQRIWPLQPMNTKKIQYSVLSP